MKLSNWSSVSINKNTKKQLKKVKRENKLHNYDEVINLLISQYYLG